MLRTLKSKRSSKECKQIEKKMKKCKKENNRKKKCKSLKDKHKKCNTIKIKDSKGRARSLVRVKRGSRSFGIAENREFFEMCQEDQVQDVDSRLDGSSGTVLGWGKKEEGLKSEMLMEVNLPVLSNHECSEMYR